MNTILKTYYNIESDVLIKNYFTYNDQYFYLDEFEHIDEFLTIFHTYHLYMKQCHIKGYTPLYNYLGEIHTLNYIVFQYNPSSFYIQDYLKVFLSPLPMRIPVNMIKEQWIEKIDFIKECAKEYAYSYKQNIDVLSLIYYYSGLGENAIVLLNMILNEFPDATLSMCLSLKKNILPYTYELLNPTYYMYSTRARHIIHLLNSHIIDMTMLKEILEQYHMDKYEILYLFARMLFPSSFFDDIINKRIDIYNLENHFYNITKHMHMLRELSLLLTNYITIPKISWINEENMI